MVFPLLRFVAAPAKPNKAKAEKRKCRRFGYLRKETTDLAARERSSVNVEQDKIGTDHGFFRRKISEIMVCPLSHYTAGSSGSNANATGTASASRWSSVLQPSVANASTCRFSAKAALMQPPSKSVTGTSLLNTLATLRM